MLHSYISYLIYNLSALVLMLTVINIQSENVCYLDISFKKIISDLHISWARKFIFRNIIVLIFGRKKL